MAVERPEITVIYGTRKVIISALNGHKLFIIAENLAFMKLFLLFVFLFLFALREHIGYVHAKTNMFMQKKQT